jgi:sensor histidine kinase regulating citrate/malate metabolism
MIRIENYYEGTLIREGKDYVTTKDDKKLHGYGIKSIKYTADKYGGAVNINTEDSWFDIKIVIPMEKNR